jgi:hypothetical protein
VSINTVVYIINQVIKGTPVYVWILLAYLVSKGLNATKVKPLMLKKMLIMPAIFMVWGLDKMFTRFTNPGLAFCIYLLIAGIGTGVGFLLYNGIRKIFYQNGTYYRSGSYLPLLIMLTNFSIKYVLNVLVVVNPSFYTSTNFCLLYSILSGFSVGLFIGGWLQAYIAYNHCNASLKIQY